MKLSLLVIIVTFGISGCTRTPANSTPTLSDVSPTPKIVGLPVSVHLKQRSTSDIPGTNNEVSLTADDITRGQVMVSINRRKEANLLGPISLKEGESTTFRYADSDYSIKLSVLNNQLIGDDDATFVISDANSSTISEDQQIQHLISAVESLQDAVFIRNGSEHSPKEAADHLRRKLESSGGKISTAEEFINQIASGSSISNEDYQIRFADGRTKSTRDYLRNELDSRSSPHSPEAPKVATPQR